jgi:uncharacterized membrane protein YfcA
MPVFLPVAGISISLPLLVGVGALIGFLSGLFGVGGGFLLTPILMLVGIPPTVAAASDSCQIIATSSSGTAAHSRMGNVDVKLGTVLLLGGLAGGAVGVRIIRFLLGLGDADLAIKLTYVIVLAGIGGYMFWESLTSLRRGALEMRVPHLARGRDILGRLPFQMDFPRSRVRHSVFIPLLLGGVVGVLAAIMGVGGGFIMIPMMVYLLWTPMHVAVGTSLFQILFTCAGVTFMQAATNHTVDLFLALLLAAGSTIGVQVGARMSRLLRGEQLRILLALLVLLVTARMVFGLMRTPRSLLRPVDEHGGAGVSHFIRHAAVRMALPDTTRN